MIKVTFAVAFFILTDFHLAAALEYDPLALKSLMVKHQACAEAINSTEHINKVRRECSFWPFFDTEHDIITPEISEHSCCASWNIVSCMRNSVTALPNCQSSLAELDELLFKPLKEQNAKQFCHLEKFACKNGVQHLIDETTEMKTQLEKLRISNCASDVAENNRTLAQCLEPIQVYKDLPFFLPANFTIEQRCEVWKGYQCVKGTVFRLPKCKSQAAELERHLFESIRKQVEVEIGNHKDLHCSNGPTWSSAFNEDAANNATQAGMRLIKNHLECAADLAKFDMEEHSKQCQQPLEPYLDLEVVPESITAEECCVFWDSTKCLMKPFLTLSGCKPIAAELEKVWFNPLYELLGKALCSPVKFGCKNNATLQMK